LGSVCKKIHLKKYLNRGTNLFTSIYYSAEENSRLKKIHFSDSLHCRPHFNIITITLNHFRYELITFVFKT